jgi:hypothetical protein
MAIGCCKLVFFFIIPSLFLFISLEVYDYSRQHDLFSTESIPPLPYDEYRLSKTEDWKNRFNFLSEKGINEQSREIADARDHILEIKRGKERYRIEYEYEVDRSIVESVAEVVEKGDQTEYTGRYFLVKYNKFVELAYFNLSSPS